MLELYFITKMHIFNSHWGHTAITDYPLRRDKGKELRRDLNSQDKSRHDEFHHSSNTSSTENY